MTKSRIAKLLSNTDPPEECSTQYLKALFNSYLNKEPAKPGTRRRKRMEKLDKRLQQIDVVKDAGWKRPRRFPIYEGRKVTGHEERMVDLGPAQILALQSERRQKKQEWDVLLLLKPIPELRERFIACLPELARRLRTTTIPLEEAGVPVEDLRRAAFDPDQFDKLGFGGK